MYFPKSDRIDRMPAATAGKCFRPRCLWRRGLASHANPLREAKGFARMRFESNDRAPGRSASTTTGDRSTRSRPDARRPRQSKSRQPKPADGQYSGPTLNPLCAQSVRPQPEARSDAAGEQQHTRARQRRLSPLGGAWDRTSEWRRSTDILFPSSTLAWGEIEFCSIGTDRTLGSFGRSAASHGCHLHASRRIFRDPAGRLLQWGLVVSSLPSLPNRYCRMLAERIPSEISLDLGLLAALHDHGGAGIPSHSGTDTFAQRDGSESVFLAS